MQLFMIYLGGKSERAIIEVHDMFFAIASTIEETYDALRAHWWGMPETLHLDCWGAITSADGHNVTLKKEPASGENKLYFVNMGGYSSQEFTELHQNILIVAPDAPAAKTRALAQTKKELPHWEVPHRDYLFDVENLVCLNDVVQENQFHIHLEATDNPAPFVFSCKYIKIGLLPSEA